MNELNFVDLKSDTTFKYLFKTDKGRNWFIDLILHTTGIDLSEYELYDNELNSGNKKKDYRLDLLLKNNNDYIVIEMNGISKAQSIKARYYLYRVAGKKFLEGENYKETNNKLIMFNNYRNETIENLRIANYTLADKNNELELKELTICEIYLPNYKEICYDKANKTEKKLWLFNCKSFEEMKNVKLSNEDRWIVEELERLAMDEKFIDDYDAEKVNRMLMNTEHNDGFEEGLKQGINVIARNLLKNGMSEEDVSKNTKLSLEKLSRLKDNDMFNDDYDVEKVNRMLMNTEHNDGFKEGLKQGHAETTIEIAKKLLKLNIPLEQIMESTELSIKEIGKLKEELKK